MIFHLFESIQVAFFSLRIFVSVLKVKKYVLSSSCFFRARGFGRVAEAWSVSWVELSVM